MKQKGLLRICVGVHHQVAAMLLVILLAFSGCGGPGDLATGGGQSGSGYDDGGGQSGTGYASGLVSAFGSIYVNGIHFDTSQAQVFVEGQFMGTGDAAAHTHLAVGQVVQVKGGIAADGTGTADEVYYEKILEGPVDTIENLDPFTMRIVILGQQVIADNQTAWYGVDAGGLSPGMVLEVSGNVDNNGFLTATYITDRSGTMVYTVKGPVQNLDAAAQTFEINDLTVHYDMIAGGVPVLNEGDIVSVRGTLDPDGTFDATALVLWNLSGLPDADTQYAIVDGFVKNFITSADFYTDSFAVTTDSRTVFEGITADELSDGVSVEVVGGISNGRIHADIVRLGDNFARLAGNVLDIDTVNGTLTLAQEPGTLIRVSSATVITGKDSLDQIAPNDWLVVDGWRRPDDSVSATQIVDDTLSGIIVYEHIEYEGYAIPLTVGDYTNADQAHLGIHNDISSVKVARGYRVIFYDEDNFSGNELSATSDRPYFFDQPSNWNDRARSIRVRYDTGATVCEDIFYTGYAIFLSPGAYTSSDLAALGINTDISSVLVGRGYTVTLYDQDNFSGSMLVRTSDETSLVGVGWNDRARSIKVEFHPQVVLYHDVAYAGYAIPLTIGDYTASDLSHFGAQSDVFSLKIVNDYKVTFYDQDNFAGKVLVKTADDPTLVDDGWLGRVGSVKVEFTAGMVVYADVGYWGYAVPLTVGDYTYADMVALGIANTISGVKVVSGYKVTFYDQDNFTGASLVRTANDPTLVAEGWNDRPMSIRVEYNN